MELDRIINYYQPRHQLKKLSEEVYEFQEAILDAEYYDLSIDIFKNHVEEEFADVLVLMEQFKVYYNLNYSNILKIMKRKIDRQNERIDEELKHGQTNND